MLFHIKCRRYPNVTIPKYDGSVIFKLVHLSFVASNATADETITEPDNNSTMNETVTDSNDPKETTSAETTAAPSVDITTAAVSLLCHKLTIFSREANIPIRLHCMKVPEPIH